MTQAARGDLIVNEEECKGCGICVEACPPECLYLDEKLNAQGVHPARYTGEGCTGCSICFYCCPEPGAITVLRRVVHKPAVASQGGEHAAAL
jgi:NAD-dependent dihydropyrimidine dehydrogenase PreA subunit